MSGEYSSGCKAIRIAHYDKLVPIGAKGIGTIVFGTAERKLSATRRDTCTTKWLVSADAKGMGTVAVGDATGVSMQSAATRVLPKSLSQFEPEV